MNLEEKIKKLANIEKEIEDLQYNRYRCLGISSYERTKNNLTIDKLQELRSKLRKEILNELPEEGVI
jgi:hypothetical protein